MGRPLCPCCFQLPLSGSHSKLRDVVLEVRLDDFQLPLSGSRDHIVFRDTILSDDLVKLSTPSLGITRDSRTGRFVPSRGNFQLPLSGSLKTSGFWRTWRDLTFFQLPLSGSPSYSNPWIFPLHGSFNSLSRDHRARFRDFSALRGFPPRRPFAQMISKATIWIYRFAPL